jgi:hypothetical protein
MLRLRFELRKEQMAFGLNLLLWIGFAGGAPPLNPAP